MGYILVVLSGLIVLGLILVLARNIISPGRSDPEREHVDIIEGGSIVEQQKSGRELWRRVRVKIPDRPLCFEEELNLRSIRKSGNKNVQIIGSKR